MAYTPAQAAKLLESKFAAEGYGPAEVKVAIDPYSVGSTVYVTIMRLGVRLEPIDRIAREHLEPFFDEHNELLLGWNRHVDVRYSRQALAPLVADAQARIRRLADGQSVQLGGCTVTRAAGTIYQWQVEITHLPDFTPRAYESIRAAAIFVAQHAAAAGRMAIP